MLMFTIKQTTREYGRISDGDKKKAGDDCDLCPDDSFDQNHRIVNFSEKKQPRFSHT